MRDALNTFLTEEMMFQQVGTSDPKRESAPESQEFIYRLFMTDDPDNTPLNQPLDIRVVVGSADEDLGLRVSLLLHFAILPDPTERPLISQIHLYHGFIKDVSDIEVLFEMTGLNRIHEASLRDDYDLNEVFCKVMDIKMENKTFGEVRAAAKERVQENINALSKRHFELLYGGKLESLDTQDVSREIADRSALLEEKTLEELQSIQENLVAQIVTMLEENAEEEEEEDCGCGCHIEYIPLTEHEKEFLQKQVEENPDIQNQVEFCSKALVELFFSGEPADTLVQAQGYPVFKLIADSNCPDERILEVYNYVCELLGIEMGEQEFYQNYLEEALEQMNMTMDDDSDEEEEEDDPYSEGKADLYNFFIDSEHPEEDYQKVELMLEDPDKIGKASVVTELEELLYNAIDPSDVEGSIGEIREMLYQFSSTVDEPIDLDAED